MHYLIDKELKYDDRIRTNLQAYNRPLTGKRKTDKYNVYVLDESKNLVGAAITEMGWDWVYFIDLFFEDLDSAKSIFHLLVQHYQASAKGIKIKTSSVSLKNELEACGYTLSGSLSHTPDGSNIFILSHQLDSLDSSKTYQTITSKEPIESYKMAIRSGIMRFNKRHSIPLRTNETTIVCFDGETFVGGIVGYTEDLMFHTQLLFVEEQYRSKRIGSELMHRLELEAKRLGATHASVSTTSFQAYEFYIKQGYTLDLTIHDKPVGFDEYTFSKTL